jgi:hypothetical protein
MAKIDTGNAHAAGAASRGWFIGDLAAWAAERGATFDPASTPRQSAHVQLKWLMHPPGDERPAWAEPDSSYTLSLLIAGDMRLDFRSANGERQSVSLAAPGDYALWYGPEHAHWWRTEGGCTMVTVRWPVGPVGSG